MAEQGGYGVICRISVSGTLTAITNLLDVTFPEQEKLLWESTAHDTASGYVTFLATGLRQLNEFTLTLGWDDTASTHAALLAGYNSDSTVNMNIQDPDGQEVIAFAAHITKLGRVAELKGGYKCEVTVQPTDGPTIT